MSSLITYLYFQRHGRTIDGGSLPEDEGEQNFLDDINTSTAAPENLPKNSLLTEEMERLQKSIAGQYADPLQFWTILARIARVVLC